MMLCWGLRLVERFDDEFEYWWYEQETVPDIAVELTGLGRQTLEFILENAAASVAYEALGSATRESAADAARALVAMCQESSDQLDSSDRLGEHPK